jgi:sugar O-acyltransferase (sialic acid O-acetyltransferase NeuD family)
MKSKPLVLIGGGGHCKSCIDVIEATEQFSIKGIIDFTEKIGENILGYSIIGNDHDIPKLVKEKFNFLITVGDIGNSTKRVELFELLISYRGILPVIISPLAYISKYAIIRSGTIVMHHAVINACAIVGNNCIINTKALIEHDANIGDHCHISTGAIINGGTIIGARSFFGSGAVSKQYISIPEDSFIKANSIIK